MSKADASLPLDFEGSGSLGFSTFSAFSFFSLEETTGTAEAAFATGFPLVSAVETADAAAGDADA
jgi:hypothetical protein